MFISIFILSWIAFSYLMTNYVLGGYFLIMWSVLGLPVAYLTVLIIILLHIPLFNILSVHNRYKAYVSRSASFLVTRTLLNLRYEISGLEKVPKKGPLVVYSNHKSYLDALIMVETIRRPLGLTPKSTLYKIPILSRWIKNMGCMPVYREDDRKTAKAMVKAIKDLKDGFSIGVFPEGGRKDTESDIVKQTKAGAFKIAQKANAVILPISINGSSQIRNNAPWKTTKIKIIIHDPINYEDYKEKSTHELSVIVMDIINEGLGQNN